MFKVECCHRHPRYGARVRPRTNCENCESIWHLKKVHGSEFELFRPAKVKAERRPPVTFSCAVCNKVKTVPFSETTYNRGKYCSRDCFLKDHKTIQMHPCPQCGREFLINKSRLDRGWVRCSKKCSMDKVAETKLSEEQLLENQYFARMKKQFGLSREDWQTFYDKHNGCCHICKKPETVIHQGRIKKLDVDHCHVTGKVRGFLCTMHNALLGYAQDDIEILKAAIKYLEES